MAALLNEQMELPHFHFNEALFKPFENLLCLELCDSDVQDQVSPSGIRRVQLVESIQKSDCESLPDRQLHLRVRGDQQDRDTIRLATSVRRATRSFGR